MRKTYEVFKTKFFNLERSNREVIQSNTPTVPKWNTLLLIISYLTYSTKCMSTPETQPKVK